MAKQSKNFYRTLVGWGCKEGSPKASLLCTSIDSLGQGEHDGGTPSSYLPPVRPPGGKNQNGLKGVYMHRSRWVEHFSFCPNFGATWDSLGSTWDSLGATWDSLGATWKSLVASWDTLLSTRLYWTGGWWTAHGGPREPPAPSGAVWLYQWDPWGSTRVVVGWVSSSRLGY